MTPDPVQPGGQGTGQGGGMFDQYLQAVPESWEQTEGSPRDVVSQYLKDAERGVNTQLSEAADLRNRFGPYSEVDLSGVSPQQLSTLLDFVQQVSDPAAYNAWLKDEATAAGLIEAAAQEGMQPGDDLEAIIQQRIEQAINPIQEQFSASQRSDAERQMVDHIEGSLSKIESTNQIQLDDNQREAILALGEQEDGDDWIEKGYAKYQALVGAANADLVNQKKGQPAAAVRTGGQAAPKPLRSFADAREAALELASQIMD